jgi:hypothetical protein
MYTDYWIKTTDEDSWLAEARAAGIMVDITNIDNMPVTVPVAGVNIDVIGTIYTLGEYTYNPDGSINVIVAPVAIPGYHVNIRTSIPINISKLSIIDKPSYPYRVWF